MMDAALQRRRENMKAAWRLAAMPLGVSRFMWRKEGSLSLDLARIMQLSAGAGIIYSPDVVECRRFCKTGRRLCCFRAWRQALGGEEPSHHFQSAPGPNCQWWCNLPSARRGWLRCKITPRKLFCQIPIVKNYKTFPSGVSDSFYREIINRNHYKLFMCNLRWNFEKCKLFITFASTKGSFPLKEILRLREQRFYGSAVAGWKEQSKGRSFFVNVVSLSDRVIHHYRKICCVLSRHTID